MATAVLRGLHRYRDAPPWVLDDPIALPLIGPAWPEIEAATAARYSPGALRAMVAGLLVRSRYAEDRRAAADHGQYVLLGAGMDTFAWRSPDVAARVRVFEVDHPASQAFKLARATDAGLPRDVCTFVPVDFEEAPWLDVLLAAGFSLETPASLTWLGVVPYLTGEAIEATLRDVARCASGTELVLSYGLAAGAGDPESTEAGAGVLASVAAVGEPLRSAHTREELEALVRACGLEVAEHPSCDELTARYFAGRDDGMAPWSVEGLLAARVA